MVFSCDRTTLSIAAAKSSTGMSSSGLKIASWVMTFTEMSRLPAVLTTESAWSFTAASSRASTTAVSTCPPSARIVPATASSVSGVRPTRTHRAPSAAKPLAIALPMLPPPP